MDIQRIGSYKFPLNMRKWLLPLLVITAAGLRLYRLEQESLWLDEIGQVLVANNSWWLTILKSASHYGNTPLDYLITHLTLYVGQSESILRFPAVVWGVLSIVVVYRLGRDMFDKPTGYLVAFLLTVMPLHIYYSREVRFYSLATLLTLLSVYTFFQAVDKNIRWSWILYGVVLLFALYAHYYILIVIAIQGVWLLWAVYTKRYARSVFISFAFAAGLALLLFLPWLFYDIHYEQTYKQGILNTGFEFQFPPFGHLLASFFFPREIPISLAKPSTWWVGFAWAMIVGGLGTSLRGRSGSRFNAHIMLLMLILLGGVSSSLVLNSLASYFFRPRQVLIYTPLLLLIFSYAYLNTSRLVWSRVFKSPKMEIAHRLTILLMIIFSLWALWRPLTDIYYRNHKQDWRKTAQFLWWHLRSDDVLFISAPHIRFYLPERSSQIENLKDMPPFEQVSQSHPRVWILGYSDHLPKNYPDVCQWIKKEQFVEMFIDRSLPLYVYSASNPTQLLDNLFSGPYASSILYSNNSLEMVWQEGYGERILNLVPQMLEEGGYEITEEKIDFAIRAARIASDRDEHDEAINILVKITSLDPDKCSAWLNLGVVYNRQGTWNDAISAYRKSLECDSDQYWSYHLLASILYHQKQWQDVIDLEEQAVQFAPSDDLHVASLVRIALSYSQLDNNIRACKVFRQAYAMQESRKCWMK